jgi:hypothetical protein
MTPTELHALECIRCRAHLLEHDAIDMTVWARLSGDETLQAAAYAFAKAQRALYDAANRRLVEAETVEEESEAGR